MKKINLLLFPLLLVIITAGDLTAKVSRPLVTTGEAFVVNITPEEAQHLALKRARVEAIEKVCGIRIQAETLVRNYSVENEIIHSIAYGHIVSEEVLDWKANLFQQSPKRPPEFSYQVKIKTTVEQIKDDPDPFYKVKLKLNKTVYKSGDEMVINVQVTKPSYISVLNICADDSVVLLFPNQIRKDCLVNAGETYQIPSKADQEDVLKLQVSTLPGHKKNTEYIKVLATREPIYLLESLNVQGNYGVSDSMKFAAKEIARMVSSIPVKDRAVATASYQVVSQE